MPTFNIIPLQGRHQGAWSQRGGNRGRLLAPSKGARASGTAAPASPGSEPALSAEPGHPERPPRPNGSGRTVTSAFRSRTLPFWPRENRDGPHVVFRPIVDLRIQPRQGSERAPRHGRSNSLELQRFPFCGASFRIAAVTASPVNVGRHQRRRYLRRKLPRCQAPAWQRVLGNPLVAKLQLGNACWRNPLVAKLQLFPSLASSSLATRVGEIPSLPSSSLATRVGGNAGSPCEAELPETTFPRRPWERV